MRAVIATVLLLAACASENTPVFPSTAAGSYRLDYSGVYGVGQVDLQLSEGKVSGLNPKGGAITYRGFYRTARDVRFVTLDLIAHLPPVRQVVKNVAVVAAARDVAVRFDLPADLGAGGTWPVRIETQQGPVSGTVTRVGRP